MPVPELWTTRRRSPDRVTSTAQGVRTGAAHAEVAVLNNDEQLSVAHPILVPRLIRGHGHAHCGRGPGRAWTARTVPTETSTVEGMEKKLSSFAGLPANARSSLIPDRAGRQSRFHAALRLSEKRASTKAFTVLSGVAAGGSAHNARPAAAATHVLVTIPPIQLDRVPFH